MFVEPVFDSRMLAMFLRHGVQHPEVGVFITDLNFHTAIENRDPSLYALLDAPFGVCDSLEQLRTTAAWDAMVASPLPMVCALTPIRRADQPDRGGWRWRKWGEYIGRQEPRAEYLRDEPVIELVHVWTAVRLRMEEESKPHRRALEIADQMIHHVPALACIRASLTLDIMNEKWHHVAASIARVVLAQQLTPTPDIGRGS